MTVEASVLSSDLGDVIVHLTGQAHDTWEGLADRIRAGVGAVTRRGGVVIDLTDVVVAHRLAVVTLARELATDFGSGAVRLVCPRLPARRLLRRMLADVPVGLLPTLETALAATDPELAVHGLELEPA